MTKNQSENHYTRKDEFYSIDSFLELTWEELFEVPVHLDQGLNNVSSQNADSDFYDEEQFLHLTFEELFNVRVKIFRLSEEQIVASQDEAKVNSYPRELDALTRIKVLFEFTSSDSSFVSVNSLERNFDINIDFVFNGPPELSPPPPLPPPSPPSPPSPPEGTRPPSTFDIFEKNLPEGSDPDLSKLIIEGNIFDVGDAVDVSQVQFDDLTMNGISAVKNGNEWTLNLSFGTLVFFADDSSAYDKGDFRFTLNDSVVHEPIQGMNSFLVHFNYQYTLTHGDVISSTIIANIIDDVPDVTIASLDSFSMVNDDSALLSMVTDNVTNLFHIIQSADKPTAVDYTLSITANGLASGLFDVETGTEILLEKITNDIIGYIVDNSVKHEVFRISLDSESGDISVLQSRAILHPTPESDKLDGADDETVTLEADLIQLTATVTDGDLDSNSVTADIGHAFSFKDAYPSISLADVQAPTLTTDDTYITDQTDPVSFAGLFTSSFGNDGFKDGDDNNIEDPDALSYELLIKDGDDTNSGLDDTLSNEDILLKKDGDDILGYYNDGFNDVEVFRISLDPDTGDIFLSQSRSMKHPTAETKIDGEEDEFITLASNLIQIKATVTDGDLDTASATADIGDSFSFKDAYPSIEVDDEFDRPVLMTDDTNITDVDTTEKFSLADLFKPVFGKDEFKDSDDDNLEDADAVQYELLINGGDDTNSGLDDTLSNEDILLKKDGDDILGYYNDGFNDIEVFRIILDTETGKVSLSQSRAIEHPTPEENKTDGESDESIDFMDNTLIQIKATITDGDLDTASATANIGDIFSFKDAYPTFTQVLDPNEDNLIEVNTFNPTQDTTYTVQLADWIFGHDDPKSIDSISLSPLQDNIQIDSSTEDSVVLHLFDAASNLSAVLTLNADGSDSLKVISRSDEQSIQSELIETPKGKPVSSFTIPLSLNDLSVKISGDNGDNTDDQNDFINESDQGLGVGQNVITQNESLIIEVLSNNVPQTINNLTFTTQAFTAGSSQFRIAITVWYNDTDNEVFELDVSNGDMISIEDLPGFGTTTTTEFQKIEVEHISSDNNKPNAGFRIDNMTIYDNVTEPPADLEYEFSLIIADGDSDTASLDFSFHLDGDPVPVSGGITVDGPIEGAIIFQDINENNWVDAEEVSTVSMKDGSYQLQLQDSNLDGLYTQADGRLVSIGGRDTLTGLTYDIPMYAPLTSQVISPLTSLLEAQLRQGKDKTQVHYQLAALLGFAEGTDLTILNPLDEIYQSDDPSAFIQAASIMTLSTQLSAAYATLMDATPAQVADNIYLAIGDQLLSFDTSNIVPFSDQAFILGVMDRANDMFDVNKTLLTQFIEPIQVSQQAIEDSVNSENEDVVEQVTAIQTLTQGYITQGIEWLAQGRISADTLNGFIGDILHSVNDSLSSDSFVVNMNWLDKSLESNLSSTIIGHGEEIFGDTGNNLLYGLGHDVTYTGGEGEDIFMVDVGSGIHNNLYTITDFNPDQDKLLIHDVLPTHELDHMLETAALTTDEDSSVTLTHENHTTTLIFQGMTMESIADLQNALLTSQTIEEL